MTPSCRNARRISHITDYTLNVFIWRLKHTELYVVCLYMTTLTEVFPCFFLSCKANARVKPAKTGHGPHFS